MLLFGVVFDVCLEGYDQTLADEDFQRLIEMVSDLDFATYKRSEEVVEGCARTTLGVSSACLTEDGFEGFKSAFVDIEHGEDNCASLVDDGRLPPVDGIVVSEETDGLVAKVD